MALAEMRLESGAAALGAGGGGGGGGCSLPQCSLLAPAGLRCASDRLLDGEQGLLRIHRRKTSSRRAARRGAFQVVQAATNAASDEDDTKSGTRKLFKLPGTFRLRKKDTNLVFVAGATGNVGSRTVKELVKSGLRVRAGVRSVDKAELVLGETITSITSSSPWAKILAFFGLKQDDQLQIVDCDLEKPDDIEPAIGNAGIVICAIGASEKEVLDVTGPYRIDYEATKNLIAAAKNADVKHFILVTSLGTTKFGLPASLLNLFWGVLVWKAKAERSLVDSGLPYTIVRPGGMERPTDAYKETHNLRLAPKDTFSGGQVSRLQVAELLACIANNLELAEDKILEAIAETSAPLRPIEDLLEEIPSQTPVQKASAQAADKRKRAAEALAKAEEKQKGEQSERREAREGAKRKAAEEKKAQEKAIEAKKAQELRQKVAAELSDLKQKEAAAAREAESIQKRRIELAEKAAQAAQAAAKAEAVAKALLAAAKEGKTLSEADKRKILEAESKKVVQPPKISMKAVAERPKASKKASVSKKNPEAEKLPVANSDPAKAAGAAAPPSKETSEAATVPATEETPAAVGTKTKAPEKLETTGNKAPAEVQDVLAKDEAEVKAAEIDEPADEAKPEPVTTAPAANGTPDPVSKQEATAEKESEPVARKPFRWFWQQEEAEAETSTRPLETEAATPETDSILPVPPPKLSPYPGYSDLKPPSSPTPAPPAPPAKLIETPSEAPEVPRELTAEDSAETETAQEREEAALSKARSSLAFRWPWQKESTAETASPDVDEQADKTEAADTASSAVQDKTEETFEAPAPAPAAAKDQSSVVIQEEAGKVVEADIDSNGSSVSSPAPEEIEEAVEPTAAEDGPVVVSQEETASEDDKETDAAPQNDKEKTDTEAALFDPEEVKKRELEALAKAKAAVSFVWPWKGTEAENAAQTAVEEQVDADGAPPAAAEVKAEPVSAVKSRPLSPYQGYPDLKPPAPPSPPKITTTSATSPEESELEPEPVQRLEETTIAPDASDDKVEEFTASMVKEREEAALAKARAALSWRWEEDIKINSESNQTSLEPNEATASVVPEQPVVTPPSPSRPPTRPLSPYYRYEDLKPPTSPMPRPPVVDAVKEIQQTHKTPQTSSASVGDAVSPDVVDKAAQEANARAAQALEKAKASTTMKWPWA